MRFVSRTFVSLEHRDFRYLMLSTFGIGIGQWFQQIGMGFLVYEATHAACPAIDPPGSHRGGCWPSRRGAGGPL